MADPKLFKIAQNGHLFKENGTCDDDLTLKIATWALCRAVLPDRAGSPDPANPTSEVGLRLREPPNAHAGPDSPEAVRTPEPSKTRELGYDRANP